MTVVVNVNSYGHLIKLGWLDRIKLIPPFSGAAKFARSNAQPTQPEHVPFVGVYFIEEKFSPLGDANHGAPRFECELTLGFSYIILNNDHEVAEDMLDAAHWSLMKLFHDPAWHVFPDESVRLESVIGGKHSRHYGNLTPQGQRGQFAETPYAEMRMEMTYFYGIDFEPIITDAFQIFHMTTAIEPPMDPNEVLPIVIELNLPQ